MPSGPTKPVVEPEPTAAYVRDHILRQWNVSRGIQSDWTVTGPVARGRQAIVYRADCEGSSIAVKIFRRRHGAARLGAIHDFQSVCYQAMQTEPGCAAPEPIACLAKDNCLLMEWIFEPPAAQALYRAGAPNHAQRRAVVAAARWLRTYQNTAPIQAAPFDAAEALSPVRQLTEVATENHGGNILGKAFARHVALLEETAESVQGISAAFGRLHGDFMPHNLFHSPERTVGIDFSMNRQGFQLFDASQFLVSLHHGAVLSRLRRSVGPCGIDPALSQAFLESYLPPGETVPGRFMAWVQLLYLLRRWASTAGKPDAGITDRIVRHHRLHSLGIMAKAVSYELQRG